MLLLLGCGGGNSGDGNQPTSGSTGNPTSGSGGGSSPGAGGPSTSGGSFTTGGSTTPAGGVPNTPGAGASGAPSSTAGALPGAGAAGTVPGGGAAGVPGSGGSIATAGAATGGGSNCPATKGMISNFESGDTKVIPGADGFNGAWELFSGGGGTGMSAVEKSGDTAACNQYALHAKGSGYMGYVGVGFNLKQTGTTPMPYDASKWAGIRFKAKKGATNATPVRFNVSTSFTEMNTTGGTCTQNCYNHLGRYLVGAHELTDQWKTFTFCFDRDFYPLFLPSPVSTADRRAVANSVLKMQFQFNKSKDLAAAPVNGAQPEFNPAQAFDLWVDDVEFVEGDPNMLCPGPTIMSAAGTMMPFPQNKPYGSCMLAPDAAKFNGAIAATYAHWKATFVKAAGANSVVFDPLINKTPSEAIAYGMMITAAVGDKDLFAKFWAYAQTQFQDGKLMKWREDGDGSATDADVDIAYALIMADKQWGGYAAAAAEVAASIRTFDISGGNWTEPGSNYGSDGAHPTANNPSYFAPSHYRSFNMLTGQTGMWTPTITNDYNLLNSCATAFAGQSGLVTDWCRVNGTSATPATAADFGAQVTNELGSAPVYGYDAARVPWRIGMDACLWDSAEAKTYLGKLIGTFASAHAMGARIDALAAGWTALPAAHASAKLNQMSFIGPVGVGAMGLPAHSAAYERAFRAVLDIIDNPEFNRTYYPTTLGLITLLQMSGNFPPVK